MTFNLPSCAVIDLVELSALTPDVAAHGQLTTDTILLKGKVGEASATCLFDTGAEANFLAKHFVDKLQLGGQMKRSLRSVRYADGTIKEALGEIELPLQLLADGAPQDATGRFIVADLQRQFDLILGMPFCQRYEPSMDWTAMTIKLRDQRPGRNQAYRRVYKAPRRSADQRAGLALSAIEFGAMEELFRREQINEWFLINIRPQKPDRELTTSCSAGSISDKPPPLARLSTEELQLAQLRQQMLREYTAVFSAALPPVDPKAALKPNAVLHHIKQEPGTKPFNQPLRRMSTREKDELYKQMEAYLRDNRIRPSESPHGSNVIMVKKKDGSLRFCVDYRGLNERTVKNKYPLPLTDELFDRLTGARYFSKIDLRTGFYQILMAPEDIEKTAFKTDRGLFEWTVLPMGLCNAPATFQHLMNTTFRSFLDRCVLVFLDDIVVYSHTLEQHVKDVRAVLQRLKDAGLHAKESKCELFQTEIEFLGHRVGRDGLKVMPDKIAAVRDWATPTNATELRSFLGLTGYYRRFIEGFSRIAAPLHELTQSKPGTPPFKWTPEAQTAFDQLKQRLQTAPILQLPDPDRAYVVHTDASDYATGAVLQQDLGEGKGLQPVAFVSHKMLPAERNYQVHDKEMLAIIKALGEWRTYLHGRLPFKIRIATDHNSLQYFMTKPDLTGRQVRWLDTLANFDFKIEYVKGATNVVADALSRNPAMKESAPLTPAALTALTLFDTSDSITLDWDHLVRLTVDVAQLQLLAAASAVPGNARRSVRAAAGRVLHHMQRQRVPRPPPAEDTPAESAQRTANEKAARESSAPPADLPAPNKHGAIVMPSQRCTAKTRWGGHCRMRTGKGEYCFSHRRLMYGLHIRKSTIPGAGFGIVATRPLPVGTRVLYSGDIMPLHGDGDGGAYYLQLTRDRAVDAARTNAGDGRWLNDPRNTGKRGNCKFVADHRRKQGAIVTTRPIDAGDELLVPYGASYWRLQAAGDARAPVQADRPRMRPFGPLADGRKLISAPAPGAASVSCAPVATRHQRAAVVKTTSTAPSSVTATPATDSSLIADIRAAIATDSDYQLLLKQPPAGLDARDGCLWDAGTRVLVVPRNDRVRTRLLSEMHDAGSSGHTGIASTYNRISNRVRWPGLRRDVIDYVRSCDSCQRNKVEQRSTAGQLMPLPIPPEPGHTLTIDDVTGLPRTPKGHTGFVSMTCAHSATTRVGLHGDNTTATHVAQMVFDEWVIPYGLPAVIVSDRDPRFVGEFWRELWRLMGTQLRFSTAGHPQTDGRSENRQRSMLTMLRHRVNFQQSDWDEQLKLATVALNTTVSAATGLTPFQIMFGRPARLPLDIALEPLQRDIRVPAATAFVQRHAAIWKQAHDALLKAQATMKRFADRHRRAESFSIGDRVLLSVRDLRFENPKDAQRSHKLTARFVGPFAIKSVVNANAYELELPPSMRIHPVQNVSKLRRFIASPAAFSTRPQPLPRPSAAFVDATGSAQWEVDCILARRQHGRQVQYLVRWLGYPLEDSSWLNTRDLHCPDKIAEFLALQDVDGPQPMQLDP